MLLEGKKMQQLNATTNIQKSAPTSLDVLVALLPLASQSAVSGFRCHIILAYTQTTLLILCPPHNHSWKEFEPRNLVPAFSLKQIHRKYSKF